mmetsp:Transcript_5109/g.11579  ORF Transcript_5109/g.11579 Transcript_5109/m.11579 type:complete len:246 (+) Transcript_5109:247-984(+)
MCVDVQTLTHPVASDVETVLSGKPFHGGIEFARGLVGDSGVQLQRPQVAPIADLEVHLYLPRPVGDLHSPEPRLGIILAAIVLGKRHAFLAAATSLSRLARPVNVGWDVSWWQQQWRPGRGLFPTFRNVDVVPISMERIRRLNRELDGLLSFDEHGIPGYLKEVVANCGKSASLAMEGVGLSQQSLKLLLLLAFGLFRLNLFVDVVTPLGKRGMDVVHQIREVLRMRITRIGLWQAIEVSGSFLR